MSGNCCIQFTLWNPPAGVSSFFEKLQGGAVQGGWIPAGLLQGFVCHLPVTCSSVSETVLYFRWQSRSCLTAVTLNLEKSGG